MFGIFWSKKKDVEMLQRQMRRIAQREILDAFQNRLLDFGYKIENSNLSHFEICGILGGYYALELNGGIKLNPIFPPSPIDEIILWAGFLAADAACQKIGEETELSLLFVIIPLLNPSALLYGRPLIDHTISFHKQSMDRDYDRAVAQSIGMNFLSWVSSKKLGEMKNFRKKMEKKLSGSDYT